MMKREITTQFVDSRRVKREFWPINFPICSRVDKTVDCVYYKSAQFTFRADELIPINSSDCFRFYCR